jgi:UDP-GlcNAc:undecaprenyl-phosphate/decaprenyl-phosphate GlcNAc-1-phosphate transferase
LSYAIVFMLGMVVAEVTTWALRFRPSPSHLSTRRDQHRRLLDKPRVGGLSIFIAFLLSPLVAAALVGDVSDIIGDDWEAFAAPYLAGAIIVTLGAYDDVWVADFKVKFLGQGLAGFVLFLMHYRIDELGVPWGSGSVDFSTGMLALPLTLFWVMLVSNALNLVDGKDGVAGGVGLIAAAALAVVALDVNRDLQALLLFALAGAILGFLPFNFPPAKRFLGDSGAMFIGFTVAALSIEAARGPGGAMFFAIPILILGFPLLDTTLAALRRFLESRHPFFGDEDHVHHRIERVLGFGPQRLVVALWFVSALFAAAGLVLHLIEGFYAEVAALATFALLLVGIVVALEYHGSMWNAPRLHPVRRKLGLRPDEITAFDPSLVSPREPVGAGRDDETAER